MTYPSWRNSVLERCTPTLRTPGPSLSDSDDVLLALETAQALEVRGDLAEAARWLRRAANEAEKQGNDTRVLALAHAAADLTSASAQAPPALRRRVTPPPLPVGASSLPAPSPPISSVYQRSAAVEQPVTERKARMGAIRVAIKKPTPNARSFSVERLDAHQPLPPGAVEAVLVLTGDVDEPAEAGSRPFVERFLRRTQVIPEARPLLCATKLVRMRVHDDLSRAGTCTALS